MKNPKSARGLYYDTKDSNEYFFVYKNLKFYFSGEFNMRRFKEKVCRFTFEENSKIVNRYKINIDLVDYFVFSLYQNIEKRGYKIEDLEKKELIVNDKKILIAFESKIVG